MNQCRICGRSTLRELFTVRSHALEQCQQCGFVQVREQPEQSQLDAIYEEAYFGHNKYRDEQTLRTENLRRLRLLQQYVSQGRRVLEAGCGDGSFIQEAQSHYDMWGFDLSPAGIELARKRNPHLADRLWVGVLEDQSMEPESFDAICMWDVIEHVWDPLQDRKSVV